MSVRWVVDAEHPAGHAVEMTAEEQAQHDAEQAANLTVTAAHNGRLANERTMTTSLTGRMQDALDLAAKLDSNTATPGEQRAALALSLRGLVRLTRVTLDVLDQAD